MPLLTPSEALGVSDSFLQSLYGEELFLRWKELKAEMQFITEREYVSWLIDLASHYKMVDEGMLNDSEYYLENDVKVEADIDKHIMKANHPRQKFTKPRNVGVKSEPLGGAEMQICEGNNEVLSAECFSSRVGEYERVPEMTAGLSSEEQYYSERSGELTVTSPGDDDLTVVVSSRDSEQNILLSSGDELTGEGGMDEPEADDIESHPLDDPVTTPGDDAATAAASTDDGECDRWRAGDNAEVDGVEMLTALYSVPLSAAGVSGVRRGGGSRRRAAGGAAAVSAGAPVVQCPHCPYASTYGMNVRRHVSIVHERRRLHRCDHCAYTCSLKAHLKSHNVSRHGASSKYGCHRCGKYLPDRSQYHRHTINCSGGINTHT